MFPTTPYGQIKTGTVFYDSPCACFNLYVFFSLFPLFSGLTYMLRLSYSAFSASIGPVICGDKVCVRRIKTRHAVYACCEHICILRMHCAGFDIEHLVFLFLFFLSGQSPDQRSLYLDYTYVCRLCQYQIIKKCPIPA